MLAPASPKIFSIEALSMTKRFGDFVALDRVDLKVNAGSFHALLGENGAGKSTLVKCIMGYERADEGDIIVGDRQRAIDGTRDAQMLGLGMVYQHFTLVPSMTVAENFALGRSDLPLIMRWREERERIAEFFAGMPFRIPLDVPVSQLAAGEKQKAEILRQLYLGARFLILDEPTSVLTPNEADEILGVIHGMTREERLTVLLITHKMREVMAFADELTVLRRGQLAGTARTADVTPQDCARMMLGTVEIRPLSGRRAINGAPCLELVDLAAENDRGTPAVKGATLAVRSGEIVGIAGVSGNGQRELMEVLGGQREPSGGRVLVNGKLYRARREDIRSEHVALLPEEPLRNACVPAMSVAENLVLRRFDEPPFASGGWWLHVSAFRDLATKLVERYRVKTASLDAPIRTLSGGNVQRAVLARELGSEEAEVLIVANPCFGLDLGAVAEIHAQLMDARNRGAAVLLVSEDLDELLELSDRIVVMFSGRFVADLPADGADRMAIGRHMTGH